MSESKDQPTNSLFSLSRWFHGFMAPAKKPSATPACPFSPEESDELLSCSELSSNAMSDEVNSSSSLDSNWTQSASASPEPNCPANPCVLPPCYLRCVARIQEELQGVVAAFPADTPPSVLSHALAYVLQTKWNWQVKFCCQPKEARVVHMMPAHWVQDVLVVIPAEQMHCVVDLQFRDKFTIHSAGSAGERYASEVLQHIPEVYVGPLAQLFRDLDRWTAAVELVFQEAGLTLPPWRMKRTFQLLYKACIECDGTPSACCLERMVAQMADGPESGTDECHAGCMFNCGAHLACLGAAVKASQCHGKGPLSLSSLACKAEPLEFEFAKEHAPTFLAETQHSGLSFLLSNS